MGNSECSLSLCSDASSSLVSGPLSLTPYVMVAANSNLSPTFLDRGVKPPLYHGGGRRDSSR